MIEERMGDDGSIVEERMVQSLVERESKGGMEGYRRKEGRGWKKMGLEERKVGPEFTSESDERVKLQVHSCIS